MNSVAASAAQPSSSVDNLTSPPPTRSSRPLERESLSASPKSVVAAPRFGAAASSYLFQQAAVLAAAATQRKQMQILSRHMALAAKGASSISAPPPPPPLAESYYDYRDDEASLPPALGSKDPDPQLLNAFFTSALQAASTLKQCSQGGISPLQAIANMPYPPNGSTGGVGINANGSPYSRTSQRSPYAGGQAHPFAPDRAEFHQHLNYHHYHHPHHYTSSNGAPLSPSDSGVARQNGGAPAKIAKNGPSKLVPPAGPNSLIRPIAKPHPHHHSAASSLAASTNGAPFLPKAPVNIAPKPGPPNSRASAPDPGRPIGKVVKSSPPVTITSTPIFPSPPKSNLLKYSPLNPPMPPLTKPLPPLFPPAVVSVGSSIFGIEKIIEPGVPTTPKATTFSSSATTDSVITNVASKCTEPDLKTPARKRSLEGGGPFPPTPKQVCKKKSIDSIPAISAPPPVKTMTIAATYASSVDNTAPTTGVKASTKSPSIPGELKSCDREKPNAQGSASQVKAKTKKKPAAAKQFPGVVTSPPLVPKSCSVDSMITASQVSGPITLPSIPQIATVISHAPSHTDNYNNNNSVGVNTTASPKTHSHPSQTSTTSSHTFASTLATSALAPKATMPLLTPKRNKQADTSTTASNNGATREFPSPRQAGSHHKAASAQNAKQAKSIAVSLSGATVGSLTPGGGSIGRYKTVTPALTGSTPSTPQQQTMAAPQQFLFYSPATNQFYSGLANTPINNNNNANHHQVAGFNNFYGGGLQSMLPHAASNNPNVIGYATAGLPSGLGCSGNGAGGGTPNNGTGAVSYLIINANPHHNQTPALSSNPFFHHQALGLGGGSGLNNGCLSFQTTPPQQQANLAAQSMPAAQYKSPGIGSLLNLASLQVGPSQASGSPYQNLAPQMGQHQVFYQANPAPPQPTFISTCPFPQTTPSVSSNNISNSGIQSCSSVLKCRDSDKASNHLPNKVGGAGGSLVTERAPYKSIDDINNNDASQFDSAPLAKEWCCNDTEAPGHSDPEQQPHDVLFHLLDGHVIRESSQPLPLPTEPFRLRFMAKHGFRTASPSCNIESGLGEAKSGKRPQNCTSVITQGPAVKKAKSDEHSLSQEPGEIKNMLAGLSTSVSDVSIKSEDGMPQSLVEHHKVAIPSLSATSHVSVIQMTGQASVSTTPFHSLAAQGLCGAPSTSPPYDGSQLSKGSDAGSPKEPVGCSLSQTSPTPSNHDIKESSTQPSGLTFPSGSEALLTLPPPPKDIQRWTVNDVHSFISNLSGCREYAETFKANEIDGPALLLLKEDHLTSALKIKLGPALKIHARLSEIRFTQSI